MWRHAKEACDISDLKLAQLQKLGVFVGDTHFVELHTVFQHQDLASVGTRLSLLVGLTKHLLGLVVLEGAGKLNPAAGRLGVVGKEACAVVLGGQRHAEVFSCKFNRAHAHQPV